MKAFLERIPARLRSTIDDIATDIWDGYLNAASEFVDAHEDIDATIVIDRFHVAKNYRDSFDKLRKKELRRLKAELSEECYAQECKDMLWPLRKNHSDLNPDDRVRLRTLFAHSPLLHQAYTFREELTAIFNRTCTVAEAEVAVRAWIRKVEASSLDCYDTFIKTLRRYWTFILNYFERRVSSGFVEGLNNKIKTIKRRCYGISKPASLFQRIWLDIEGRRRFFLSTP
ncbi:MAG: transposase [Moorea sp. SIO1G6]|uniref:transposase n=1 Tax=Moorena sp. SIO1G6 TaxID=2607840 RepID=UPI0013C1064D|nr:transposase [Moorena sp. SIO1G6]NET69452.1 transposase [Moorena sp. SIO1G6]